MKKTFLIAFAAMAMIGAGLQSCTVCHFAEASQTRPDEISGCVICNVDSAKNVAGREFLKVQKGLVYFKK